MRWKRNPEHLGTPADQDACQQAMADRFTFHQKNNNAIDRQQTFKNFIDKIVSGQLDLNEAQIINMFSSDPALLSEIQDYLRKNPGKGPMSEEEADRITSSVQNEVFGRKI